VQTLESALTKVIDDYRAQGRLRNLEYDVDRPQHRMDPEQLKGYALAMYHDLQRMKEGLSQFGPLANLDIRPQGFGIWYLDMLSKQEREVLHIMAYIDAHEGRLDDKT
jgi:hypothetical protein